MGDSKVDIKIGEDLIGPIIKAKIETAIVEAMSDERGVIERVVAEAISKKVEKRKYSSQQITWIEKLCHETIRGAAHDAITEWAETKKEAITKEFLRQLSTKKTSAAVVKAMISGLTACSESEWKFSVDIKE